MTGIPGGVEYDDPVSADQVHPEASGPCGHEEQLDGVVGVEVIDHALPVSGAGAAVQPEVVEAGPPHVLQQKVDLCRGLFMDVMYVSRDLGPLDYRLKATSDRILCTSETYQL